jgi:transposase
MWKPEHRVAAELPPGLRYPSDLIDAEVCIAPLIPPARRGRWRKRSVHVREGLNAFRRAAKWNVFPKDLPPHSTVHLLLWDGDGTLERIHEIFMFASPGRDSRRYHV